MRAYNCPSCGATLVCDATTAATACPYCGNPTIVPGQFTGMLKPDFILPFKLEKEQAIAALKKHYENKPLLPDAFKDQNHLQEIKGVYVPFWLYDSQAEGDISYKAARSRRYTSGDYEITETEHFQVEREGTITFSRIPVDASTKMPDDYMDSIEPFDYQAMTAFSTAYLPGYMAEKYDVSAEDAGTRADERAEATTEQEIRATVSGYHTVTELSKNIHVERGQAKYALLPVWLLTTQWNEKTYLFAMNGQTGKFVGDLPVDKRKKRRRFWLAYGITALITLAAVLLFAL
jgi:DNA-directed RNA polymerase subunit RPC12/RpoP